MREKLKAIAKARWADPIAGAKLRAALYSPASRAKMSEAAKARDPIARQKIGSASKQRWADPSMREKIITGMRATKTRLRKRDIEDG
jgi:hypothetical protein